MQPIYLYRNEVDTDAVRVDRFPELPKAMTTISVMTSNFVGRVIVEATIKLNPEAGDWFVIAREEFGDFATKDERRRNRTTNARGRFISMRVLVLKDPFTPHGIVDRVTVI